MTWNYRVVKRNMDGDILYGIYEVYYDGDRPVYITTNPIHAHGDTKEELKSDVVRMLNAFDKSILTYEDF
jgi:hypothetical protein